MLMYWNISQIKVPTYCCNISSYPSKYTKPNNIFYLKQLHTLQYIYIYVDVVPLMKSACVVENSEHCIYSIGLKCF